jgi:hypothetical protein
LAAQAAIVGWPTTKTGKFNLKLSGILSDLVMVARI